MYFPEEDSLIKLPGDWTAASTVREYLSSAQSNAKTHLSSERSMLYRSRCFAKCDAELLASYE